MRAASNLILACIVCLLKCAAPSTAVSNITDRRALNLVAVSPRPETNASATSSFVESQDSATATKLIDHERSNDEERSWECIKSAVMKMIDAFRRIWLKHPLKDLEKIDVRAGQDGHIIEKKLKQWIVRADKYNSLFHAFDDAAIVDSLRTKLKWEAKQLVEFFASLYHSSGDDRFLTLQKALGEKFPLDVMLPLWWKSRFEPREVYQMMSIATDGLFTSDGKGTAAWTGVLDKLIRWMDGADKFYGMYHISRYDIFKILAEFRQPEELFVLFTSLPPGWEERAEDFQSMLYQGFPTIRPKVAEIWLEARKTPEEVYDLTPITRHASFSAAVLEKTNWDTVCDEDMERFLYTDKYMDRSIIFSMDSLQREKLIKSIDTDPGDNEVAAQQKKEDVSRLTNDYTVGRLLWVDALFRMWTEKALVRLLKDGDLANQAKDRAIATLLWKKSGITRSAEVAAFFHRLRRGREMMSRADRMQQQILIEGDSKIEKVVFTLWLNSRLNPEQVYHMMPFAMKERFGPVVGRRANDWKGFSTAFKQWLRYVARYCNGDKTEFDDGEVTRVLTYDVKNREELMFLSKELQTEPEWKELADLLKVSALTMHE